VVVLPCISHTYSLLYNSCCTRNLCTRSMHDPSRNQIYCRDYKKYALIVQAEGNFAARSTAFPALPCAGIRPACAAPSLWNILALAILGIPPAWL
jgi:hypothetical protein